MKRRKYVLRWFEPRAAKSQGVLGLFWDPDKNQLVIGGSGRFQKQGEAIGKHIQERIGGRIFELVNGLRRNRFKVILFWIDWNDWLHIQREILWVQSDETGLVMARPTKLDRFLWNILKDLEVRRVRNFGRLFN